MTRTREEKARDLQLEELVDEMAVDLAEGDEFECVECQSVLDNDESVSRNGELICALCDEQLKVNASDVAGAPDDGPDDSVFFGFSISAQSFEYLNEDPEQAAVTPEQIAKGMATAKEAFQSNHYQLKEQFFEFVLDLCEACIWDAAKEATHNQETSTID